MQRLIRETTAYKLLQSEGAQGRLAHAYLLLFNDERNLRFALKEFAKLFFPPSAASRIDREIHPDCRVYPAEGKTVDKDVTAAVLEECALTPVEGGKKLFVLDGMHRANAVAQNKLLKVLEEPPENAHFLLGATTEFSLLPTVLSRVNKLEILPFSPERMGACLERTYPNLPKERLYDYAAASEGVLGRAQDLIENGKYEMLFNKAMNCVSAHGANVVTAARALDGVKEKTEILSLMQKAYREMLNVVTGRPLTAFRSEEARLERAAAGFTPRSLLFALDRMTEAEKQIHFNANLVSCVEVNLLKIDEEYEKCKKLSE